MEFRKFLGSSVTLAWIAIGVSVAQFCVSFPLITNYYSSPKILIVGSSSINEAAYSQGHYSLKNTGHGNATNIELGLLLRVGDNVRVTPFIASTITKDTDSQVIYYARVEIARLLPGEEIYIEVLGGGVTVFPESMVDFFNKAKMNVPSIRYLRSDQGAGVIQQSFKPLEVGGTIIGPIDSGKPVTP